MISTIYQYCYVVMNDVCVVIIYLLVGWLVLLTFLVFQMGSLLEADSLRACSTSAFFFSISGRPSNDS